MKIANKTAQRIENILNTGADPENIEPGDANCINHQTEPGGGGRLFFLFYI